MQFKDKVVVITGGAKGIGKTTLPGGNESKLIESIKRMMEDFEGDYRILPGHRGETTLDHERKCGLSLVVTGY